MNTVADGKPPAAGGTTTVLSADAIVLAYDGPTVRDSTLEHLHYC